MEVKIALLPSHLNSVQQAMLAGLSIRNDTETKATHRPPGSVFALTYGMSGNPETEARVEFIIPLCIYLYKVHPLRGHSILFTQLSEESLTIASATVSIVHTRSNCVSLLDWPHSPLLQMSSICRGRKTGNRMGRKTPVLQTESMLREGRS